MTSAGFLAHLADCSARMASTIRADQLSAPVTSCPGWSLHDLVLHVGRIHRWATLIVRTGARQAAGEVQLPSGPQDAERLARWFETGAADLLDVLAAADPDSPCWTFAGEQRAGFWLRRQAQETAMHCWDAEAAVTGRGRLDPELAADGIDEVIEVFLPRQRSLGGLDRGVALRRTDGPGTWVIGPSAAAELSATAEVLLLLLWQRLSLDQAQVAVTGDRGVAGRLLQGPLVP